MPFPIQDPHPFTEQGIKNLAANQAGVYGIYNSQKWIYIGKATDIKVRLLEHFNKLSDQSACIWRNNPTHFAAVINLNNMDSEETALIRELASVCNKT